MTESIVSPDSGKDTLAAVDALAAVAGLVMGKTSNTPAALIRAGEPAQGPSRHRPVRSPSPAL